LVSQDNFDHSVESTTRIAKAFWHIHITVCPEGSSEAGFLFVCFVHEDLVVTGETIEHAQHFRASRRIDQGVNAW